MPWYLYSVKFIVLCVSIFVETVVDSARPRTLPPVNWSANNSIFKTSDNDHVIDVNMNDAIDFECPHYPSNVTDSSHHEYYVIYMVSQASYENCMLSRQNKRQLMIVNCSQPSRPVRVTISVITFSPVPGKPEFRHGETYYFITTSGGKLDTINNDYHGACHYKNMKISLRVCCESTTSSSTQAPPTSRTRTTTVPTSAKWRASTTTTTTEPQHSTTKKYRDDDDSDENESLPKAGSHVNSATCVSVQTVWKPVISVLVQTLVWLYTTR